MIIKSVVIIAFILIIISLGSALFHLVNHKNQENSQKTVKSLTLRIALSLVLFIFIFFAVVTGQLKPHGLGVTMHTQDQIQPDQSTK